jgi:hypothetical protein
VVSDPVLGKVIVEFSQKYISVYLCEGDGTIKDADHFKWPVRLEVKDTRQEVRDCYHLLYDFSNKSVNPESASDG